MKDIFCILIIVGLVLLLIAMRIYQIANSEPKLKNYKKKKVTKLKNYKKKKNKYYNPNNNYFRNSPEHVDVTNEYIQSIWDEIQKK